MNEVNILKKILDRSLIKVSSYQCDQIHELIVTLQSWNKKYNLTSIDLYEDICNLHIVDSALASPYLRGNSCLDVGSGAGFPGIVLAILNPEKKFTLIDSNNKKTIFQQRVISSLSLKNITAVHSRVEDFSNENQLFDTIISRAFSSFFKMIQLTSNLCAQDGFFISFKSKRYKEDMADNPLYSSSDCQIYTLNNNFSEKRFLIEICKAKIN